MEFINIDSPIINDPFFNFMPNLTSALIEENDENLENIDPVLIQQVPFTKFTITRPNNKLLDTFTWNTSFVLPLEALKNIDFEAYWIDANVDYEYFSRSQLWRNNSTISNISAFDFIEQRFRFLTRERDYEARTELTPIEIVILQIQTNEFYEHFESKMLCLCESNAIDKWLVRVINIILNKNLILDEDFVKINETFQ